MPEQYPPPPDYPPPPEYLAAPYPPPPAFPYPPPYGAPYAASMPMPVRGTNGFAIASLVCGILGLCAGLLAAIPAIVFGHVALAQINRSDGMEQGRGIAIAGLVLGYIFLAFIVLYIAFIVAITAVPSFQSY
jgi:Domain of unknown function (DUF4190)